MTGYVPLERRMKVDHKITAKDLSESMNIEICIASQFKGDNSKKLTFTPYDLKYRLYKNKEIVYITTYSNEAVENYNEL